MSVGRPAESTPAAAASRATSRLEYVTIPGCADCRRFEQLLDRVRPDFPELEVEEVASETPRGMALSVGRGALRFPVIVLDDEILAVETIEESVLRAALAAKRNGR